MCSVEMRKDIVGRWNTMLLAICELVERMKDVLLGCDLALTTQPHLLHSRGIWIALCC